MSNIVNSLIFGKFFFVFLLIVCRTLQGIFLTRNIQFCNNEKFKKQFLVVSKRNCVINGFCVKLLNLHEMSKKIIIQHEIPSLPITDSKQAKLIFLIISIFLCVSIINNIKSIVIASITFEWIWLKCLALELFFVFWVLSIAAHYVDLK